ncbi:hypothetical protein [Streptomyces sp. NPDC053048]|uniref:hypothetical protein n=1 Tax=Streptomyces sp. NPDC053048 TaxID=3365694 RepID=UPI0037CD795F
MNELAELAGIAGSTITNLMVTDAWLALRTGLIGLWQRVMPGQADTITADLDALQATVTAAHANRDQSVTEAVQQNLQQRIAWLLLQDPAVAEELRQLLADPPRGAHSRHIEQHVSHSGTGDAFVAGGDITVNR